MPAIYEAIKQSFRKKGMKDADAKSHAARIFNAQRKPGTAPVTRYSDEEANPNEVEPDHDADDKPKAKARRRS